MFVLLKASQTETLRETICSQYYKKSLSSKFYFDKIITYLLNIESYIKRIWNVVLLDEKCNV